MEKYSINQRVLIVKTFYQNQSSITVTMRKLREIFGRNNVPTKRTIYRVVNDFEERENPQIIHQSPLHPLKVTVWCAVWSGGIIGPYFFENENGVTVTVIENFLTPQLHALGLINMWYQQDGATSHTARITMELLRDLFPQQVISKNGDVDWPPRSPDLTAPDFFLWGYLKSKAYANKPETLEQLKQNIRDEINEIPREMCENVMKNVLKRARICEANRGGHLSDIVFHT